MSVLPLDHAWVRRCAAHECMQYALVRMPTADLLYLPFRFPIFCHFCAAVRVDEDSSAGSDDDYNSESGSAHGVDLEQLADVI